MNVFVECNPDEVLAISLSVPRKQLTHLNDKGRVCTGLSRKHTHSIGMIDEDPNSSQPTYLSQLVEVEKQFSIRILFDKHRSNKIIILQPRLEEWLLFRCKEANLQMSSFGLSSIPKELHRETGSKATKLKPLISKLLELNNPAILYLKHHLSGIKIA